MEEKEVKMRSEMKPHYRGYRYYFRCVVPQPAPICEFFVYLSGFREDYRRIFQSSPHDPVYLGIQLLRNGIRYSEIRPLYGANFKRDIARVKADGQFYKVFELDRLEGMEDITVALGFLERREWKTGTEC